VPLLFKWLGSAMSASLPRPAPPLLARHSLLRQSRADSVRAAGLIPWRDVGKRGVVAMRLAAARSAHAGDSYAQLVGPPAISESAGTDLRDLLGSQYGAPENIFLPPNGATSQISR